MNLFKVVCMWKTKEFVKFTNLKLHYHRVVNPIPLYTLLMEKGIT